MDKVRFGVFLPFYAFKTQVQDVSLFSRLCDIVRECERLGFDSVWVDDHLMSGDLQILECWTTLSALASTTSKIRLGTMVTSNAFRHPALLAKMAATVDVISHGRLELGLGAGIQKAEHEALDFPFPNLKLRAERLSESIEIIKSLWTKKKTTYSGKHFHITCASCEPKPVQKPRPPIIIGGCGEKHTLNVTAEHADRLDFGYLPDIETYKRKLQALKTLAKRRGRDFAEIERSCWPVGQVLWSKDAETMKSQVQRFKPKSTSLAEWKRYTFVGEPDELVLCMQSYLALGVTYFMLFFGDLPKKESLRIFAKAVKAKFG